jgi:hypothetical protein
VARQATPWRILAGIGLTKAPEQPETFQVLSAEFKVPVSEILERLGMQHFLRDGVKIDNFLAAR